MVHFDCNLIKEHPNILGLRTSNSSILLNNELLINKSTLFLKLKKNYNKKRISSQTKKKEINKNNYNPFPMSISSFSSSSQVDCTISSNRLSHQLVQVGLSSTIAVFCLCLEPINILLNLCIVLTFIFWPDFRQQPADLIFGISVSQLFQSLISLITAAHFISDETIDDGGIMCKILGVVNVISGVSESAYSISFCCYVVLRIRLEGRKGFL